MVLEATHSNTHEMNPFSIIQVYIKSPLPNKLKTEREKHRMLDSAPSWFFVPACQSGKLRILPVWKVKNSVFLPSFILLPQKLPRHVSNHYSTISLMNTFEISFIFVRQDKIEASLRQQIAACMGYIFFSFTKKLFFLGQHLIGKLRFLWVTRRQIIITYTFIASKHVSQESIQP